MGKKKLPSPAAKKTKVPVSQASVPRSKRIRRGQIIMERIKERIAGKERERNPAGTFGQDRPVTPATRKRYEAEELARFSAERKIDEAILRVDVQLAMLMAAIEDDADDELKAAVVSGRLPLTESALRDLHPLSLVSGARIVKQLRALRDDLI